MLPLLLGFLTLPLPQKPAPMTQLPTPAARATHELGLAVYRALDAQRRGENLFVSPLSITVALSMLAEGAREQTAAELAHVLGLGAPTEFAALHADFQALLARYRDGSGSGGSSDPALRERVARLREELAAANADVRRYEAHDWRAAGTAVDRAHSLAAEINRLLPQLDRYELRTANALWVDRSFDLLPTFPATLDRFYGTGGVQRLDLRGAPEAARQHINAWVEEHTERHIRDLIPPGGIDAATQLVLGNAVFFRGEWAEPFDASATRDEDFRLADGTRTRAQLMHDAWRHDVPYAAFTVDDRYFATPKHVPAGPGAVPPATYPGPDGFTMIELPYKGGELAMVVLAPRSPDGLPRLEARLSSSTLTTWLRHLERRTVVTTMLRFELRQSCELSGPLQAAGMRRAFVDPSQPKGARFDGITDATSPERQLFVSNVHHQAWLQVHEKGTEAAAATAIAMAPTSAMPRLERVPFTPEFRADRPFLFLIRDVKSGAILFLGRVTDPRT